MNAIETPWAGRFDLLLSGLRDATADFYGERLVSLAVFGSVGRGTMRPDSDLDILVVAEPLPRGRIARVQEFSAVEERMRGSLLAAREGGVHTYISPVLKTSAEVRAGSPLFLDMVDDARMLFDRDGFFQGEMDAFRDRLARLGAKRVWRGGAWFWDLKPDFRPGEVFEI